MRKRTYVVLRKNRGQKVNHRGMAVDEYTRGAKYVAGWYEFSRIKAHNLSEALALLKKTLEDAQGAIEGTFKVFPLDEAKTLEYTVSRETVQRYKAQARIIE